MAEIGLTQEQIDAMLSGATGESGSGGGSGRGLSAAEAQSFADFERDTMGNFPSVINAMTGFDYRLSSVDVAQTSPDEIGALAGDDLAFSIPLDVNGPLASFLVLDQSFAKHVAAALTGGEAGDDLTLTEMELSAITEVISQGTGSYLTSLGRALRVDAAPAGAIEHVATDRLAGSVENGALAVSIMMDDSSGHAAHIMHVIPPRLARTVLDGIRAAQAPVAAAPAPAPVARSGGGAGAPSAPGGPVEAYGSEQQRPAAPAGGQAQLPPVSSGKVMEGGAQYQPAMFTQLGISASAADTRNLDMLLDVPLQITVELGKAQIPIRQILEYGQGSLITLDKLAGEPIDMLVNGRYFAKAEVVVIDENFGVRITSILSPADRLAQVR
jgi:flagellar motor switch protein FliN/FliY